MARLRPEQLDQSLAQGIPPILLISGEEPLLVQESADKVRQAARAQGYSERELYHADPGFDWQQIVTASSSLSLFAEKKILELRLPSGKPGDKGARALVDYATQPPDDTLLLIIAGKLDKVPWAANGSRRSTRRGFIYPCGRWSRHNCRAGLPGACNRPGSGPTAGPWNCWPRAWRATC